MRIHYSINTKIRTTTKLYLRTTLAQLCPIKYKRNSPFEWRKLLIFNHKQPLFFFCDRDREILLCVLFTKPVVNFQNKNPRLYAKGFNVEKNNKLFKGAQCAYGTEKAGKVFERFDFIAWQSGYGCVWCCFSTVFVCSFHCMFETEVFANFRSVAKWGVCVWLWKVYVETSVLFRFNFYNLSFNFIVLIQWICKMLIRCIWKKKQIFIV